MKEKLLESFQNLVDMVVSAAPKVLTGFVLILLALLVAKIVEKVLRAILVRIRFDSLVERVGIDKTLQKAGIRQELNRFIPRLAYFLLLFLLAKTVTDALGLVAISDALSSFFAYLPNLVAALLLLVLGSAAAQFAGSAVRDAAESSGIDFAGSLGRVVSAMIFFIVGIMAFTQLKIDTDIIRLVTSFVLAGGALAFGLSFGLGTREITRGILAGFYARRLLRVGRRVEIGGREGVLTAITPTHAVLSVGEETIHVSNTVFLDEISRQ